MRPIVSGLLTCLLLSGFCNAGEVRTNAPEQGSGDEINAGVQTYRGYQLDLSEFAHRQDFAKLSEIVRTQIDLVEGAGLSRRVLDFIHTVRIEGDELACLDSEVSAVACYAPRKKSQLDTEGFSVWDSRRQKWTISDSTHPLAPAVKDQVVYVRPWIKFEPNRPTILHEMLHAFHDQILPQGNDNPGVLSYYNTAKSKQLYAANSYAMRNQMEFFAVTASVFLYGKDDKEPFTREKLKEKQPDYYKYLVGLFEFDPDRTIPVASATLQDITGIKSASPILPGMSAASK